MAVFNSLQWISSLQWIPGLTIDDESIDKLINFYLNQKVFDHNILGLNYFAIKGINCLSYGICIILVFRRFQNFQNFLSSAAVFFIFCKNASN